MAHLTRRGALNVTTDIDRIANLFQHKHEVLGIPVEYASKFAYYCDILSDRIERHAIKLAEEDGVEAEEEEEVDASSKKAEDESKGDKPKDESKDEPKDEPKKEAARRRRQAEEEKEEKKAEEPPKDTAAKKSSRGKKADDETGLSVDHGTSGFDANAIADEVSGPLEIIQPPVESWMKGFFQQDWFQELCDLQQAGAMSAAAARGQIITKAAAQSVIKLRRIASVGKLSSVEDLLKVIHAKLLASDMSEVKAMAADVKKQIDAVSKVRDVCLAQQAVGMVEPEAFVASERIVQAVSEQLPYLQQIVTSVDGGSPLALLEFQKMIGGGSLKELVALGASIVVDAAKNVTKKDDSKEASAVTAGEVPEAFKKNWDKDEKDEKDESKDEKDEKDDKPKDEPKKDASEDSKEPDDEEEKKEASEEEESEEDEDSSDKSASDFGYNLFA